MANLKTTEFPDGIRFQAGDLILAQRDDSAISLPGSVFVASQDFNPPAAGGFSQGMWADGATGRPTLADTLQGLTITDASADTSGIKLATRVIPAAMQGAFSLTARVSYNTMFAGTSGCGIAVATDSTGTTGRFAAITRYGSNNATTPGAPGPVAFFWDGASRSNNGLDAYSGFTWMQIRINGSVADLYISDEGVNWIKWASRDLGAPITQYGFAHIHYNGPGSSGLCTYFDSTEFPFKRF